ncbi:response regulator [Mucilaginibacter sp. ZT4R22]|uniref:Response regulator n=1 Tax=Mucilaginibacter pankratovii TaxID=2772110 RepID=A0ABR7WPS8_9SPHI|nr:response regulator [Mucilaginibacter pankratovii]MBD1363287.1 response regulator [Mucilaginibacter pankratovii]
MNSYVPVNVLIIDDDPIHNFIFEKFVRRVVSDANISFCSNGEAGIDLLLELIRKDDELFPRVIFLDIKMPVMDGWGFLEEYHRLNMDSIVGAKIYITTSSIFMQDKERALNYVVVEDFISKPVSADMLEQIFE